MFRGRRTLHGSAGALVALGGLWIGFLVGRLRYGELTADLLGVEVVNFLLWFWSLLVVLGGMAVGVPRVSSQPEHAGRVD